MSALLALAFGAGLLAPVNPCGFALLPAYLTTFLHDTPTSGPGQRLRRALGTGAAITLGFSATLTAIGLALAAGLRALIGVIPWLAAVLGLVLTGIGVAMLLGRHLTLRLPRTRAASVAPTTGRWRLIGFGAGYALASASCTLAILLAVVAQALAASTLAGTALVFAAYAAGSAILLLALAVTAALANTALSRALGRLARHLPRISGALLAASGLYLIVYWAPTLLGGRTPSGNNPLVRAASAASTWISTHQTTVITLAAALVATATLAAIVTTRRSKRRPPDTCRDTDTPDTTPAADTPSARHGARP